MSGTRVHLRFAQELEPGASVEALRRIFPLPDDVTTVADVNRAISARFQLQSAFVLALKGSRFHAADPATAIRDGDILHLVAVTALPPPRAAGTACMCGANTSCQFSNRQWGFLCKGRAARCQQCADRAQAVRGAKRPIRSRNSLTPSCPDQSSQEQPDAALDTHAPQVCKGKGGRLQVSAQARETLEACDRQERHSEVLRLEYKQNLKNGGDRGWDGMMARRAKGLGVSTPRVSSGGEVRARMCPTNAPAFPSQTNNKWRMVATK
jgi:hypothetical protein